MNEDGRSRGGRLLRCSRCDRPYDVEDNYCRHCGVALHASRVPMVREERAYVPVPWRESMPTVVRGAAVVAAGTLAEAVLRRIVGRALRRTRSSSARGGSVSGGGGQARLPARGEPKKVDATERLEASDDDDRVVSETFLFRRVRLRRGGWPGE